MADTATAAAVEINDEFTLKPGELTKEQAADRFGCSTRNIEIMKSQGKLAGEKVRRRVDGVVKQVLIFHEEDIDKLKEPVKIATVEQKQEAMGLELHAAAGERDAKFFSILAHAMDEMDARSTERQTEAMAKLGEALGLNNKVEEKSQFLTVEAAAEEKELSPAGIRQLIKDGKLEPFPGKHGRTMISRRQLEAL
jgi:hypothetical protein